MGHTIEKNLPNCSGIIAVIIAIACDLTVFKIEHFDQILNAVVNLNSILIGFLGTVVTIIAVSHDSRFVKLLNKMNRVDEFVSYFTSYLASGIVSTICSVIFLGIYSRSESIYWVLFLFWLFLLVFFLASVYRMLSIIIDLLGSVLSQNDES